MQKIMRKRQKIINFLFYLIQPVLTAKFRSA